LKLSELPANTIPYIKAALTSYAGGEVYSEFNEVGDKIFG
jgi:hypothetical protein